MSKSNIHYNGPLKIEVNGKKYQVEVEAKGTCYYQPCVMYFKDGSGQPEDWDYETDEFKVIELIDWDTEEDMLFAYNSDPDFKGDVDDAIYDELYDVEWEFPEDPYDDYEPDYEPEDDI